jgi:predicted ATPase/class 3 adenylate cyclase
MRADLPTGTVTFLFTDIEGSTRILQEFGAEDYANALAEHRRVLREASERHGGVEVDTQGDALFVAFSTAPGALDAARAAQAELELPVRMGLHTGTPLLTEEGYVGADVHRAARIAAAGHGRQVLVSTATAALVDRDELRDLGEHRLKDLSAPQRLFQLGTAEFPRPRTLRLTNLPVPATEFLGRDRELAEVVEQLRNGVRLLTLTGPGGTGKTRLALQAVAEAADDFADGVWWVPLAALRDPAIVLRHTARTLDVVEQPDRPLEEVLAEMLNGKRMLLVLDNAEHLLPGVADAIGILRDLNGPKLVVTSRERLQLTGEHAYPVPQLTPPEGLDLFAARAAAIDPRFQADDSVTDLCSRLDNLPLAIELAAARTAVLQPDQILERLGSRLDLLKGARDADPRQQTLRATIAWSFDLLRPEERELATRFSVFAGGATLEAEEEICGADLETLASLVDKSLLRHDGDRFWMLETIREYGRDELGDSGREDLIERHGAYFERFATEAETGLHGLEGARWLDLVERELPNLRATMARALERGFSARTLRIAAGLGRYWQGRSSATEGRRWLDQALASSPVDDTARAGGLLCAGVLAFFQGDLAAADEFLSQAARFAYTAKEVFLEAGSQAFLVWVAHERGNPEAGGAPLQRSRVLLTQLTDPWERSEILLPLSCTWLEDPAVMDEVLALKREAGDVIATSDSLNNVGWEALIGGDLDRATANLEEAVAIARQLGDTFRITLAACNLGLTAVLQKRHADALEHLRETLLLSIHRGDRRCGSEAVLGLAAAVAALGEDELSVQLDAIRRALMAEAGMVYEALLLERLEAFLSLARTRLGAERLAALEAEIREPTLERALELLDETASTRIASPNE